MPKLLAVYLPQFYATEDNNKWWGEGFTDWESVKSNTAYFTGHESPWVPLQENYYDLSDVNVMKCQAELAKKYGIDGFCFYHYYFKDGKKELELPAENLLRHPEISIQFCFNWANESWIRSWSKFSGNIWGEKYECKENITDDGLLVEQDYGDGKAWEEHFSYLLPFFRDERYIKIDGKPVFIFYRPMSIPCLKDMVTVWRNLARQAGFPDLYLVGVNANSRFLGLDASLIYQPRTAINQLNDAHMAEIRNGVRCFHYDDLWDKILKDEPYFIAKTYFTGVTGYDDTARRGKSGECLIRRTPEIFQEGMYRLLKKSIALENPLVFINAWNEWGEGMYLEPDDRAGYAYLEAVSNAKQLISEQLDNIKEDKDKYHTEEIGAVAEEMKHLQIALKRQSFFTETLSKWLECERCGRINLHKWFVKHGATNVAIYGLGILGKQFYQQMEKEGIHPVFGIDRYVGSYGENFEIFRPEDTFPEADLIVVTAFSVDGVIEFLKQKCAAKIFLIQDVIEYFWRDQNEYTRD